MLYDLWDVFQQGQIAGASQTADAAKRDAAHTDARLHNQVLRLDAKIDKLALICHALFELLHEKSGITEQEIQAKIGEIDLRDGRRDGRIAGQPTACPKCRRPAHTSQRVCLYCSTPIPGGTLVK